MYSTSKWTSLPRVTVSPPPSLLWSRLRWLPMAWPPGCSVFFPSVWRGQTGESFSPACSVNLLSVTNVFGTPQHVQLQTTGANEHADWMGSELWRKQDMNRKGLVAMMEVANLRQKCKKKKWLQLPGTFIISICMLFKGEWKSFLQFLSHSFSKG